MSGYHNEFVIKTVKSTCQRVFKWGIYSKTVTKTILLFIWFNKPDDFDSNMEAIREAVDVPDGIWENTDLTK